jgi:hypothetical protein
MPVISRYVAYSPSTRQHQSPKNTQHQVRISNGNAVAVMAYGMPILEAY